MAATTPVTGHVVMTGTRHWPVGPQPRIEATLRLIQSRNPAVQKWVMHHGGCRGADTATGLAAAKAGWQVEVHAANWERYGRAAGPVRNREMVDSVEARAYLVVHPKADELDELKGVRGSGTADCLKHMFKKADSRLIFHVVTEP